MKKIFVVILIMSLSIHAIGQSTSSEVVNASVPKGAKHISTEELSNYLKSNYKHTIIPTEKPNIFKINDIIIGFWDLSVNYDSKKSLEKLQSEIIGYHSLNPKSAIYFSKIETVNNVKFLIYEYKNDDDIHLRFQSEYNSKGKNICGIVLFKKTDEDTAHAVLKEFLESVHFREL